MKRLQKRGGVGPDGEVDNNLVDLPSPSEQGNSSSVEGEDFVLDLGSITAPKRDPKRNAQARTSQRIQRKAAPDTNQSKRSVVVLPRTQTVPVCLVFVFLVFLGNFSVGFLQRCCSFTVTYGFSERFFPDRFL